eukprot:1180919-Prorocentrum_minimum.AAC.1
MAQSSAAACSADTAMSGDLSTALDLTTKDKQKAEETKKAFICQTEVCDDTETWPSCTSYVPDDECQRLFILFDNDFKGYITEDDVARVIRASESERVISKEQFFYQVVGDSSVKQIRFTQFQQYLTRVSERALFSMCPTLALLGYLSSFPKELCLTPHTRVRLLRCR